MTVKFYDKQKAHTQFWTKYERPPLEEYWDYIVDRRDSLVPQDIRARKGSFYTPRIWVELSQKYLADVFGKDWQDEYYIWDCAAGTGNLLAGLTNKYNIWASTIDKADVDVMHDRIENGANLLHDHCFQFDFLNDDFSKLPQGLQDIINDPKQREKLIVYINPPYAETHNKKNPSDAKIDILRTKIQSKYENVIGAAGNELFAQFLVRIYFEIPNCFVAEFSKLKMLLAPNFKKLRKSFLAKLEKCFVIPAYTFDNVKGNFPIGFKIWNTTIKEHFDSIISDVYNEKNEKVESKIYADGPDCKYINSWYKKNVSKDNLVL
jgi:hypothetical protein